MKKIVFLTDVRYWQQQTGAQQRISSLIQFMIRSGHQVTTLFAAPLENVNGNNDRELISTANLEVISLVDDWNPTGLIERIKWKGKCVLNALSPSDQPSDTERPVATLESLQTPEFVPRVEDFLQQLQPDIVVVQYVTLAYLLPPKSSRTFVSVLDSHDLLASRCRQFNEQGHQHWIQISEQEEFDAFRSFDCVLAIQKQEAETIRKNTEGVKVVVCGHPASPTESPAQAQNNPENFTVGYLASDNAANRDALDWLLDSIWPIVSKQQPTARLVLAGGVCQAIKDKAAPAKTEVLGQVDRVKDFYSSVDLVLNPIRFGTGLKIKTVEAIQFARPLISTTHGIEAMAKMEEPDAPWIVADTPEAFATRIIEMANSPELFDAKVQNAEWLAQTLKPAAVYREWMKYVENA